MPVTELNGVELYHEDHGEGPAVVLCHGGGLSHVDFFQQVLGMPTVMTSPMIPAVWAERAEASSLARSVQ